MEGGSGVTAVSGLLCLYGEGVRGQIERLEENISDIFWQSDGKSLMQTSYMQTKNKKNIIMQPLLDLCKHFNIWPVLDF